MDTPSDPRYTTLEVTYRGKAYSLKDDDMLLFQTRLQLGRTFDFKFPGDNEPTSIDFNQLRTRTVTTVTE